MALPAIALAAGPAIGGIAGFFAKRAQARGMQRATDRASQTAMGGFNWLNQSPIGQQYLPAGGQAIAQQQALLGLGGDTAAAQAAYDNYLNSIGFQGQMQAGQQAISSNRAAAGLLGSGSTAKALQAHGQQLGAQSFNNYLGQLGGVAGMGLNAGGMLGQSANYAHGMAGQTQFQGGLAAADARARGWEQLISGLGSGLDAWAARGG